MENALVGDAFLEFEMGINIAYCLLEKWHPSNVMKRENRFLLVAEVNNAIFDDLIVVCLPEVSNAVWISKSI